MHIAARPRLNGEQPSDDPVRREAYERALQVLRGRPCATAHLTDDQIAEMGRNPAPENVGKPELFRR
jgi:hypothetical protein